MKFILTLSFLIASVSSFAKQNYSLECYGSALSAAKAIDSINFPLGNQSSVLIDDIVQKSNKARIVVQIENATNRKYTVKLRKNRSAQLVDDQVTTEPGCFVESIN